MSFTYSRTIYLNDTDAAGVVYFASAIQICHEAYEESLLAAGIKLQELIVKQDIAIPIARAEIDFYRPLFCSDRAIVRLTVNRLKDSEFTIAYKIYTVANSDRVAIDANTRHVCINPQTRRRISLPEQLSLWIANDRIK